MLLVGILEMDSYGVANPGFRKDLFFLVVSYMCSIK